MAGITDQQGKALVLASAALSLGALFYFMKARRKSQIVISKEKFFPLRVPSGLPSSSATAGIGSSFGLGGSAAASGNGSGGGGRGGGAGSVSDDRGDEGAHPEGPNIGFGSDPSWLAKDAAPKTDLLHTGSKGGKLLVVTVGLPGRGKTYIARKVSRYLRWISYRTRVFSLAKYRLDKFGGKQSSGFFDPQNAETYQQRVDMMASALEDVLRYLNHGGEIGILDGTNVTKDRRDLIRDRVALENGFEILWIEAICDADHERPFDELSRSLDFIDREDYMRKMEFYQQNYLSLMDNEGSYIKVYNNGEKLFLHGIHGFLRTKIASFVMNLHTKPRSVYLTRHGENLFNSKGLIGGDSQLSSFGQQYAAALDDYMQYNETGSGRKDGETELVVWCSTMRCARETSDRIKKASYVEWRALREIEAGVCDGLTYEQIKVKFPTEYRAREQDKLRYRYPRGESYFDVITRLEPIIFELERNEKPLLIVAHQAVLRCLYAYFLDIPMEELPYLAIPLHTLIKLEPMAYGCKEKRVKILTGSELPREIEDQ